MHRSLGFILYFMDTIMPGFPAQTLRVYEASAMDAAPTGAGFRG